jgi:hypothetical protein
MVGGTKTPGWLVREHPSKTSQGKPPAGVPAGSVRPFVFPPWRSGGFLQV